MTVSSGDILARMRAVLPKRWFGDGASDTAPNVQAVLGGLASGTAFVSDQFDYVKLQTRIATATDANLELISSDFFGTRLPRWPNESDASYRKRIQTELLIERGTLDGMKKALHNLTGFWPKIWEPAQPNDGGAYSTYCGAYGKRGHLASLNLPGEVFIIAYRPLNVTTVPNVEGYRSRLTPSAPGLGGYGGGSIEYVEIANSVTALSDQAIMDCVSYNAPAGVKCWVCILNSKAINTISLPALWVGAGNIGGDIQVQRLFTSHMAAGGNASIYFMVGHFLPSVFTAAPGVAVSAFNVTRNLSSSLAASGNVSPLLDVELDIFSSFIAAGGASVSVFEVDRRLASTLSGGGNISGSVETMLQATSAFSASGNASVSSLYVAIPIVSTFTASGNASATPSISRQLSSAFTAFGNVSGVTVHTNNIISSLAASGNVTAHLTYTSQTAYTTVGAGSYTVPAGCSAIMFEGIGGGGNGSVGLGYGGNGGGGGAYATSTVTVTPGQVVYYNIGGTASDTWFNVGTNSAPTLATTGCLAKGGTSAAAYTTATGGQSTSCVGSLCNSGGNGGWGDWDDYYGSAGGGGAAGPYTSGYNGGNGSSNTSDGGAGGGGGAGVASATNGGSPSGNSGSNGGQGYGGTGAGAHGTSSTLNGSAGSAGTGAGGGGAYGKSGGSAGNGGAGSTYTGQWLGLYGPGGGGGGSGGFSATTGGNGGLYGAGGGGGSDYGTAGLGAQGIGVMTLTLTL